MVRTGKIITQRFTAVLSQEDCPGMTDLHHNFEWIGSNNLQMLRCDRIGGFDGFFHIISYQKIAKIVQRFLNDLTA